MINNIMEKLKANVHNETEYIITDDDDGIHSDIITFMPDSLEVQSSLNLTINELGKKLLQAAHEGNVKEIRLLLGKGAPFTADWLGTSPLHLAAQNNHLEVCEIFLRAGMCKDTRTKVERTPLHMAVYEGHLEVAECLLEHGADPDAKDMLHMTPLHWAVQNGHAEIAASLIRHGATTTATSKFELTPLDIAMQMDRTDIVQIINYTIPDPLSATKHLVELNNQESNEAVEPILHLNLQPEEEEIGLSPQVLPIETILLEDDHHQELLQHEYHHHDHPQHEHEDEDEVQEHDQEIIEPETNQSFTESMKLLQEHGITMLQDDESNILNSVMETGHSVVLTEAGKQALNSIKAEKLPSSHKTKPTIINQQTIKKKKIITVTADQFLAMTTNGNNSLRIVNGKLVQQKAPQLKRVVMKKNKVVPVQNIRSASTNNAQQLTRVEPVNDVELLMEQLTKAHALVEAYKKRLVKTEHELQKYKQKCKFLMDSQNILNLNVQ